MSANFEQGFSVRMPMWHGLGSVLTDYPGREQAIEAAGHDFEVFETPVSPMPITLPTGVMVAPHSADGFKALVRGDTGSTLSVVKKTFSPIQPVVLWDVADAIIDGEKVRYETAGILDDGRVLWVLACLNEPVFIGTDPSATYPYVLVSNYYDGRGAFTARTVTVRVVCANTQAAAENESDRSGRVFTFTHRGDVMTRIEEAKEVLKQVRADQAEMAGRMKELFEIPVDEKRREIFLTRFVPKPAANVVSDRVVENIEVARAQIRKILDGETCAGISETGYGLFQASVEYCDYYRRAHNRESLFRRSLLEPKPFKVRAEKYVRELVSVR